LAWQGGEATRPTIRKTTLRLVDDIAVILLCSFGYAEAFNAAIAPGPPLSR
jgi:hypothetical protein